MIPGQHDWQQQELVKKRGAWRIVLQRRHGGENSSPKKSCREPFVHRKSLLLAAANRAAQESYDKKYSLWEKSLKSLNDETNNGIADGHSRS